MIPSGTMARLGLVVVVVLLAGCGGAPPAPAPAPVAPQADAPVPEVVVAEPASEPPDVPERGPDGHLSVVVAADGTVWLGRRMVTDLELEAAVQEVVAVDPDLGAVIHADERVMFARVVEVMDAIRRAGVRRMSFAVQPGP